MSICQECGASLAEDSNFCEKCGANVVATTSKGKDLEDLNGAKLISAILDGDVPVSEGEEESLVLLSFSEKIFDWLDLRPKLIISGIFSLVLGVVLAVFFFTGRIPDSRGWGTFGLLYVP